jgi:N-acetylmuramic acid 6-phosphate etherase
MGRADAPVQQGLPIDLRDDAAILRAMVESQQRAVASVAAALEAIGAAAGALAERLRAGGRLIYAGAGSSGLIAIQDGAELPGTFGIARERILFLMAGGIQSVLDLVSSAEDDTEAAGSEVTALGDLSRDTLIAISASGTTPYTLAVATAAARAGAHVIGIANRPGAALLGVANHPILLDTGEEVIAGSTRLAAGTAQKSALGLLSSLANIRLGHVYDGLMVGVRPDNAKLQARAVDIIARIGKIDKDRASALLATGGSVKAAVLLAAGASDRSTAESLLDACQSNLRAALERLHGSATRQSTSG